MRRNREAAMQTRGAVLNASAQIIGQQGVNAFTLEAVARAAGVTKGGVLHHFPSKEELLNGLIDRVIEHFNGRLLEELSTEAEGQPGRWLRAYIRTVFSVQSDEMDLMPALAAAVSADHATLARIRRNFEASRLAAVNDGIDPTRATMIRLAVEGILFARSLNVHVLDESASRKVADELLRMTLPADSAGPLEDVQH